MEGGMPATESFFFSTRQKESEPICIWKLIFLLLFSSVARNTVGLSARRHSTAAALAQNAAPETQENRWDTNYAAHVETPSFKRSYWHINAVFKKSSFKCNSLCVGVGCSSSFHPPPWMPNLFKCFFVVLFTFLFREGKTRQELLIGRLVPNTHPLGGIFCSHVFTQTVRSMFVRETPRKRGSRMAESLAKSS